MKLRSILTMLISTLLVAMSFSQSATAPSVATNPTKGVFSQAGLQLDVLHKAHGVYWQGQPDVSVVTVASGQPSLSERLDAAARRGTSYMRADLSVPKRDLAPGQFVRSFPQGTIIVSKFAHQWLSGPVRDSEPLIVSLVGQRITWEMASMGTYVLTTVNLFRLHRMQRCGNEARGILVERFSIRGNIDVPIQVRTEVREVPGPERVVQVPGPERIVERIVEVPVRQFFGSGWQGWSYAGWSSGGGGWNAFFNFTAGGGRVHCPKPTKTGGPPPPPISPPAGPPSTPPNNIENYDQGRRGG